MNGAQRGIPTCAAALHLPLFQDGANMWGALGGANFTAQVYDGRGLLAAEIPTALFLSDPGKVAEHEAAITGLLPKTAGE